MAFTSSAPRMEFEEEHNYYLCGINGCILAERHTGCCIMPELGSRARRASSFGPKDVCQPVAADKETPPASDCSKPPSPPPVGEPTKPPLEDVASNVPASAAAALPAKQRLKRVKELSHLESGESSPVAQRARRDIKGPERLGINDGWSQGAARSWISSPAANSPTPSSPPAPPAAAEAPTMLVRLRLQGAVKRTRTATAPPALPSVSGGLPLASSTLAAGHQEQAAARKLSQAAAGRKEAAKAARKAAKAAAKWAAAKASATGAKAAASRAAPPRRLIVSSAHPFAARVASLPSPSSPGAAAGDAEAKNLDDDTDAAAALLGIGRSPPHASRAATPPMVLSTFDDDEEGEEELDDEGEEEAPIAESSVTAASPALPLPAAADASKAIWKRFEPAMSAATHPFAGLPSSSAENVAARLPPPPSGPPPAAAYASMQMQHAAVAAASGQHQQSMLTQYYLHTAPNGLTYFAPVPSYYGAHAAAQAAHAQYAHAAHAAYQAATYPAAASAAAHAAAASQFRSSLNAAPSNAELLVASASNAQAQPSSSASSSGAPRKAVTATAVGTPHVVTAAPTQAVAAHAITATSVEAADDVDEEATMFEGAVPQTTQQQLAARRSTNYKCGRCGLPKRGHHCAFRKEKHERPRQLVTAAPAAPAVPHAPSANVVVAASPMWPQPAAAI